MHMSRFTQLFLLSAVIAAIAPLAFAQDYADDPNIKGNEVHGIIIKKKQPKAVQLFPAATRAEPGLMPTMGMGKNIAQLHTLVDAKNNDEAIALGEKVIADGAANHFDRAVAYQGIAYAWLNKGDNAKGADNLQKSLA